VGAVTLDLAEAREAVGTAEAEVGEVQMAVTAVVTQVTRLDERLENTEGQIENVAESAAKFDTFLTGLRALLLDEATSTATAEAKEATPIRKTPTAESATPEDTAAGEVTRTIRPTRTPLPTSTPLPLPTSTSVPTSTPEQRP
jgi:DNA anti-recombination protein RmuC